ERLGELHGCSYPHLCTHLCTTKDRDSPMLAGCGPQARARARTTLRVSTTTPSAARPTHCTSVRRGLGAKATIAAAAAPPTNPPRWPCQEMCCQPTTVMTPMRMMFWVIHWVLSR